MKTRLNDNEEIIYFGRKHWIVYTHAILLAFAIGGVFYLLSMGLLSMLAFVAIITYFYFERKNDIWIITSQRLIDEWGVFSVNSKETPLDKINNSSYRKTILGMILNYGTVEIQSAAEKGSTLAKFVPSPEKFCHAILLAKEAFDKKVECPICKELIRPGAIKCRYCGSSQEQKQEEIGNQVNTIEDTQPVNIFKRKEI